MATLADLEKSRQDANVQQFLKLIANAEGVKYGYNTLFGNTYQGNLDKHPNIKVPFRNKKGEIEYSSATGAYQFLFATWERLRKKFGFKNFGGHNQDLAAIALIDEQGALNDVKSGDFKTAVNKLGGIWASLPSSNYKDTQNSKTWEQIGLGKDEPATGVKKWYMENPVTDILFKSAVNTSVAVNHEEGVIAGVGEAVSNITPDIGGIVDSAGNFVLRSVVIISAVVLIAIGFYFMFKQEISNVVKAVT